MKIQVIIEASFVNALKDLPPDRRERAMKCVSKFQREPSLPSLDFRPLSGTPGYYIIDPHRGDRIILRKDGETLFAAVDVGPHDNVYRRWNRQR